MNESNTVLIVQEIDAECAEMARRLANSVLEPPLTGEPSKDTPHGQALTAAVYYACTQLEGQGARSSRIALQLLEALARYELALGQLFLSEDDAANGDVSPRVSYRIEWCAFEFGGGLDMQEWKSSDEYYADEERAKDRVKALDIAFAPKFRHRAVEVKP